MIMFWTIDLAIYLNFLLGILFWTLIGRSVLSLFVRNQQNNFIYVFFCRLTNWTIRLVRPLKPAFLMEGLMPLYAGFYVFVVRFLVVYLSFLAAALANKPEQASLTEAFVWAFYLLLLNSFELIPFI